MENKTKTCPSAKFSKGALLIGIKNDQEEMDMLDEPIKITDDIYDEIGASGILPEKALRTANKCLESGCKQWTGKKCGVIDSVLKRVENNYLKDQLPECAIRKDCRWYAQQGDIACKVCPLVTTYTENPQESKFFEPENYL